MARLSKKEARLLLIFSTVLFFAANVIVLKRYLTAVRAARTQLAAFSAQRQTIDALLSDRAYWEERQQWLEQHQPVLDEIGAAQGELIQTLQRFARDRGITILEQTLLAPVAKPQYREVAVKLKLTAPMRDMMEWLATIQAPEAFYSVDQLSLTLDTRSKEEELPVLCTLQVGRLYRADRGERSLP